MNTKVGYSRVDITPLESVPLAGYGNNMQRLSQGVLDPLYATCIAITDGEGNSVLLCTVDLGMTWDFYCVPARDAISKKYGIPRECVIISAIHTHSAPDIALQTYPPIARYTEQLIEKLTELAEAALADRKPATILAGHTYNQGMNFVRHYILENDTYAGDNFGDFNSAPIRDHVSDADRQIQMVKFCREDSKDILMVNWQAHPTKASTSVTEHGRTHRPYISADFVGACRNFVEEKTGMHFAYFQGACGNINSRSAIKEENGVHEHIPYGAQLGQYILDGIHTMKPLATGTVSGKGTICKRPINHSENHLLPKAEEIAALWKETNDPRLCAREGRPHGIHSAYHAAHIVNRATITEPIAIQLSAACAGDLGFAAFSYEMFDTNGKWVKENSPFAMTFILECANGANSYIPSSRGFEHGCYEADSCRVMPGTGEENANVVLELLNDLHKGR